MIPLLIIAGPTAVGKSALALKTASYFNGEIISADSMQIYKEMNIGTAKPTENELKTVPHHLINIVKPDEEFTVSDYSKQSKLAVKQILIQNKLPIVCGGTGLYINALLFPMQFSNFNKNSKLREELNNEAVKKCNEYLYNLLKKIDPETAEKLHVNDIKRIIRALEIYYETGVKKSEMKNDFGKSDFDYKYIVLDMDRDELYKRIDFRIDTMLKFGLLDEVKLLYDKYPHNLNSLQAIGYKEFFPYFDGKTDLAACIESLRINTKHYAKRQITWFRSQKNTEWFNITSGIDKVFEYLKEFYSKTEI